VSRSHKSSHFLFQLLAKHTSFVTKFSLCPPSLSFTVRGACHSPDRQKKGPHASRVGRVDVVGGCVCLRVRRAAKKKMLRRLVVASAVRTHWRLSSGAMEVAGQTRAVACMELGNGYALASDPAESPVCLRIGLTSQSAVCG